MAEIVIEITPDGETRIEGYGFVGKECDAAMKDLEIALGKVTLRRNKPEYYQVENRQKV